MREYKLIRSSRRTLALEIGRDLTLTVRAPMKMPLSDIEAFVQKHDKWIEKKLDVMKKREIKSDNLSAAEIAALKMRAKEILPKKVDYFAEIMGLKPSGVKIYAGGSVCRKSPVFACIVSETVTATTDEVKSFDFS